MIKNKSKNTIIAKKYLYETGLSRIKGLMFNKKAETLVFRTRFGIHTFFVKFPIDLIILDKTNKVVFLKESVKPDRIVLWNPRYDLVVEMPEGSIRKSRTKIGDIITLDI